jgi:hypothetical protein
MQRDAVHRSGHAVLADAPVHVAAGEIVGVIELHLAGLGVVRRRQVGGAAERFRHEAVDDFERIFRCLAGGDRRLGLGELLLVVADGGVETSRQLAGEAAVELGLGSGSGLGQTAFPGLDGLSPSGAGGAPASRTSAG